MAVFDLLNQKVGGDLGALFFIDIFTAILLNQIPMHRNQRRIVYGAFRCDVWGIVWGINSQK